jgi:hypothetical protein
LAARVATISGGSAPCRFSRSSSAAELVVRGLGTDVESWTCLCVNQTGVLSGIGGHERTPGADGGAKGEAIVAWFRSHKTPPTLAEVAEAVGATPRRVFEVYRAREDTERVDRGLYAMKRSRRA